MKKIYFAIALFTLITVSVAQTKSTGTTALGSLMTMKIDKDFATSIVTITLTGPSNRWFGIGLNATSMANGTDCLYYTNTLVDAKIIGQATPITDTNANDWTLSSNTISGTNRTLILTRNFVGGTGDYTFLYPDSTLNVIWAYGTNTTLSQHPSNAFGSAPLTFTTLGVKDFTALENITIAPNPSNGVFTISKNNQTTISKVSIYDRNARVVKVIDTQLNSENIPVNLSSFAKGVYFLDIANGTDKTVRKIILK